MLLLCSMAAASTDLRPFFEAASAGAQQLAATLECKDENDACPSWAAAGECTNNAGFMHATCRKACERCELSGVDAHDALEIATYAARNLHAGCTAADPVLPCAASADRLAAVLAVAQQQSHGKSLQRFLEALAFEINADSASQVMTAAPGIFIPAVTLTAGTDAGTDATRAASVGQPAATVNHVHVTLSDGGQMPSVGLGTWLTVGQACYDLVVSGLRAGLRHIDTSENYQNHEEIGRAMADSGVLRSEIFLADKLSFPQSYSAEGVRKSVGEALRKMKTEYIDLYMLHSIGPSTAARHEAWREMVALQKEGTLRHIGVSNFGTAELRELKASFPDAPPVTLQAKYSPYHRGRTGNAAGEDFLTASSELGVVITAYCPLNDWPSKLKAVDDHHVAAIAARLGKTPAQVILRWGVQLGLAMLTRSSKPERLEQAANLDFEISEPEMARISGLAWFALSPTNGVPATVLDTFGVVARDEKAYKHVPRSLATFDAPIKACDMAWNLIAENNKKAEL